MSALIDLTGQHFGRLVVVKRVENSKDNSAHWLCKCECGNETIVRSYLLRNGHTKSCGCLQADRTSEAHTKHGATRLDCNRSMQRLYRIWTNIKTRTTNHNVKAFKNYGERGVSICDEWNDFESFKDWSLENGYQDDLTIDRIDVDGNYCPDNCRWVTYKEQNRNKRNTKIVYKGKVYNSKVELAEEKGIKPSTLIDRLYQKWTIEEAVEIPIGVSRKQYYKTLNEN